MYVLTKCGAYNTVEMRVATYNGLGYLSVAGMGVCVALLTNYKGHIRVLAGVEKVETQTDCTYLTT